LAPTRRLSPGGLSHRLAIYACDHAFERHGFDVAAEQWSKLKNVTAMSVAHRLA
jgi:hypothetical protein